MQQRTAEDEERISLFDGKIGIAKSANGDPEIGKSGREIGKFGTAASMAAPLLTSASHRVDNSTADLGEVLYVLVCSIASYYRFV